MTPLPSDVREALGVPESATDWVRVRSSPGSFIGETFLVRQDGRVRVATRASALSDLTELELDAPPRFEAAEFDAAVVVVIGGVTSRAEVGSLDRDAVRAFFEPPPAPEAAPDAPSEPSHELTAARARLLSTLVRRASVRTIETERARLVDLMRARLRERKAELTRQRASLAEESHPDVAERRADRALELAASLPRLDKRANVLEDALRGIPPGEHRRRVEDALRVARGQLAKKTDVIEDRRKKSANEEGRSWGSMVFYLGFGVLLTVLWMKYCG